MTLRSIPACVALLFVAASRAAAQLPPPPPPPPPPPAAPAARDVPFRAPAGTGTLSGRVMNDEQTPRPVRRATVTLTTDAYRTGWTQIADDNGAFVFSGLPAGRYTLAASKASFVTMTYGASRPGRAGTPIAVGDGARVTDVTVKLLRGAAITGIVRDATGAPFEYAFVNAGLIVMKNGVRTVTQVGAGAALSRTDDRGEYRIYGLPPGEYAVSADPRFGSGLGPGGLRAMTAADIDAALRAPASGTSSPAPANSATRPPIDVREVSISATYYPGTARVDDAQPVRVAAGEERSGIDVTLEYVPTTSVQGRILDPSGQPAANITLTMLPVGGGRQLLARPLPTDGSFGFNGVLPGRYAIVGRASPNNLPGSPPTLYTRTVIDVNGTPVQGLQLTLKQGVTVSGKLSFHASAGSQQTGTGRVSLMPIVAPGDIGNPLPQVTAGSDGSFSFVGVTPGRYRVVGSSSLPFWSMKSVMSAGRDVVDDGLEVGEADVSDLDVSLSDRVAMIFGSLQGEAGRPAPDFFVIIYPTDSKFWFQSSRRIKMTRPSNDGSFLLRDLPPGDYRIAAVTDVETNEWFEPSFLQQLVAASAALTLAEGERKIFPLKLGGS